MQLIQTAYPVRYWFSTPLVMANQALVPFTLVDGNSFVALPRQSSTTPIKNDVIALGRFLLYQAHD